MAMPIPDRPDASGALQSSEPHVERRVALLSIVGFWVFYFALVTLRCFITDEAE